MIAYWQAAVLMLGAAVLGYLLGRDRRWTAIIRDAARKLKAAGEERRTSSK